jgi:hypothetical protein
VGIEKWVLKKGQRKEILPLLRELQWHEFFFTTGLPLRRRGQHWSLLLAKEADQAFDVLRGRRVEELVTNKLQSPQATQSDLILEFPEQRFHLLRRRSRGSVGPFTGLRPRNRRHTVQGGPCIAGPPQFLATSDRTGKRLKIRRSS